MAIRPITVVPKRHLIRTGEEQMLDAGDCSMPLRFEGIDFIALEVRLTQTDRRAIELVLENLRNSSQNHLWSYVSTLDRMGVAYTPITVSMPATDVIGSAPPERQMRLTWMVSAVLLALAHWGCTSDGDAPSPSLEPSRAEQPSPGEAAIPDVTPVSSPDLLEFRELPMADISPEAAAYLEQRPGPISAAVVVPSHRAIYTWNGHEKLHMASVVKVAILLAKLQKTRDESRMPTSEELDLMRAMITVSDNQSATQLWNDLAGGQGLETYLRSLGLNEIDPDKTSCWGASYASAHDVALLFGRLAWSNILDEQRRAIAIELLQGVDPSQTWGVTSAAPEDFPNGSVVGVKDGWYPADCGWWVNSAGMLLPGDDRPAYTIAVLTSEQATWEQGIETVETVGQLIHKQLHGE